MTYKIGLHNENFKMTSQEMLEEKIEKIRGHQSKFKIVAGLLDWKGTPLPDTYVLEVRYRESEEEHRKELPLGGFGSQLYSDYMEKATELAEQFCKDHNLVLSTHLNSWPEYQAVVVKDIDQ